MRGIFELLNALGLFTVAVLSEDSGRPRSTDPFLLTGADEVAEPV